MAIRVPVLIDVSGDDLESTLGQDADKAASSAGKSWSSRFGGAVVRTGAIAAGAVAAVGAAIGGLALRGGFDRALNIQDAEAKLLGLGNSAETVETIMDNALAAVSGTAFGLGDAATVAANAVAAGIKPGRDLERTLSLVGDAATIAGADLSDMGSIFGQVAAAGVLMGDDIAQLQDRGIPILQLVADQLGVTAQEAKKLASEGKVSFDTFQDAIEAGMGGAALKSGETFRGALANVSAALGRLGEQFAAPIVTSAPALFQQLATSMDAVGQVIAPAASAFENWLVPAIERATEAVARFPEAIAQIQDVGFGNFLESGLQTAIDNASSWIASDGISRLVLGFNTLRGQLTDAILRAAPGIVDGITQVLPQVLEGMVTLISGLVRVVADAAPLLLTAAIDLLGQIVRAVSVILPELLSTVLGLAPVLVTAILGMVPQILQAAIDLFNALVESVVFVLPGLMTAITDILPAIITAIVNMVPGVLQAAIDLFSSLVLGLGAALPDLLIAIAAAIPQITGALLAALPPLVETAIDLFSGLITGLLLAWPGILDSLMVAFPQIVDELAKIAPQLTQAAIDLFLVIIAGLNRSMPQIVGAIIAITPQIVGAFLQMGPMLIQAAITLATEFGSQLGAQILDSVSGFGSLLYDAGANLINGLASGIQSAIGSVTSAMSSVAGTVRDYLPFSPAKVGPLSGSGSPDLSGATIAAMIASGISSGQDQVATAMSSLLTPATRSNMNVDRGRTNDQPVAGVQVVNNLYGPTTGSDVLRESVWSGRFAPRTSRFEGPNLRGVMV